VRVRTGSILRTLRSFRVLLLFRRGLFAQTPGITADTHDLPRATLEKDLKYSALVYVALPELGNELWTSCLPPGS
jgi:hypothetical protein